MTFVRFGFELLLGLSLVVLVVVGTLGVVSTLGVMIGETTLVTKLAALTFFCALAGVLVNQVAETPEDIDVRRRGWE